MSDTPRTDAEVWTTTTHDHIDGIGDVPVGTPVVDVEFAEKLERELADAKAECAKLREERDTLTTSVGNLLDAIEKWKVFNTQFACVPPNNYDNEIMKSASIVREVMK